MEKATKLTTVRFVRDELQKLEWEDQSLHLETFGFPSPDREMSIQDCLLAGDESGLQELASYLRGELSFSDASTSSGGQAPGRLRVFASHLTKSKIFVADFGKQLKALGIDLFVAHESIVATKQWADEIEANLRTCHAGIVFIEVDSIQSQWCDQEVGWLLGRGVPVPTLKLDGTDPYSPLGQRQAIQGVGKYPSVLVDQVGCFLRRSFSFVIHDRVPDPGFAELFFLGQHTTRLEVPAALSRAYVGADSAHR
ncbi:toll/interleukin-1 receptor domain-containing protein [Pseudarthrobacter sp. S6]|uniref:toll/interleukin-1 receptor domain-containing protein n=1 Tax=Pseudarthrobacter sp. S6 TaxID=3418420 RepID=UPI003CEC1425